MCPSTEIIIKGSVDRRQKVSQSAIINLPEPFGSFAFGRRRPIRRFLISIFGRKGFLLKVYLTAPGAFEYTVVATPPHISFFVLPLIFVMGDNFSIPAPAARWTVAFD